MDLAQFYSQFYFHSKVKRKNIKLGKSGISFFEKGEGRRIFLLHGWGAEAKKLVPLGEALAKNGWCVFIPDLPGFGQSPPPLSSWAVSDYARLVAGLAEKLKLNNYFLFGHSFGGRIGIKMAVLYPNKVTGLVLSGSAGLSRPPVLKRLAFAVLAKTGKPLLGDNPLARKLLYKLAREHDYQKASGTMRDTFKKVVAEDLRPLIKKIKSPVLLLWGKEDRITPFRDAEFIKEETPRAKIISFAGEGHQLPYHQPEKLAEKITGYLG